MENTTSETSTTSDFQRSGSSTASTIAGADAVRTKEAEGIVKSYMAWSAAGGLLPVPLVDVAAIITVQLKMLADFARLYGIPFRRDIGKEALSALLGSTLPLSVAQTTISALKGVPIVGFLFGLLWQPTLAAAATWAIGKVFIQHFESGGTFLTFNPATVREYFRGQFDAARRGMTGTGT